MTIIGDVLKNNSDKVINKIKEKFDNVYNIKKEEIKDKVISNLTEQKDALPKCINCGYKSVSFISQEQTCPNCTNPWDRKVEGVKPVKPNQSDIKA